MKPSTFTLCNECHDLSAALMRPDRNSDEGWNEWGEAHCYHLIMERVQTALNTKPGGGE